MRPRLPLRASLSLIAVLLAACAPAAVTQVPVEPVAIQLSDTPVPTLVQSSQPTQGLVDAPTEAVASTPLPVATSRGPDLHATDPTTVSLASGQIQFVEFFRFT